MDCHPGSEGTVWEMLDSPTSGSIENSTGKNWRNGEYASRRHGWEPVFIREDENW
jgi:hypothetical protein